ncbi:MAG: phosphoribosylglycinamide formyltransferase, partial [Spirochaetaceae bacterium]|nr:phosphoribosylglycinamide formyltransferase [Spirochaetaceae bacterium]
IGVEPVLVVVDRSCGALELASAAGIETVLLDRKLPGIGLSAELARLLAHRNIEMVALAGWLSILDGEITERWAGKMINIHPSLLPLHGGPGMYGRRVHRAVLDAGDRESGCSVHLVTLGVDEGKVLGQTRVPVIEGDTPESLAGRILIEEHKLYPQVIAGLAESLNCNLTPHNGSEM